jgi:hypothetical protein
VRPTATVTTSLRLPPAPVHVRVKVVSACRAPLDAVPDVAREPVQPPDAVQASVFCELHVSVTLPPTVVLGADAVSETTGDGGVVLARTPNVP